MFIEDRLWARGRDFSIRSGYKGSTLTAGETGRRPYPPPLHSLTPSPWIDGQSTPLLSTFLIRPLDLISPTLDPSNSLALLGSSGWTCLSARICISRHLVPSSSALTLPLDVIEYVVACMAATKHASFLLTGTHSRYSYYWPYRQRRNRPKVHLPTPECVDRSPLSHAITHRDWRLEHVPLLGCFPFLISPPYSSECILHPHKWTTCDWILKLGCEAGKPKQSLRFRSMGDFQQDAWICISCSINSRLYRDPSWSKMVF